MVISFLGLNKTSDILTVVQKGGSELKSKIALLVVVVIFYFSDIGEDCYIVTCYKKKVTARLPRP